MRVRGVFYPYNCSKPGEPDGCWVYDKIALPGEPIAQYTMCREKARLHRLTCAAHAACERGARALKFSREHFDPDLFIYLQKIRRQVERKLRSGEALEDAARTQEHHRSIVERIEEERAKPEIPTAAVRSRAARQTTELRKRK